MSPAKKRRMLEAIVARDGAACWICDEPIAADAATLDHVKPRCRGGTSTLDNLRIACAPCNSLKGHTWPFGDEERRLVRECRAGVRERPCHHYHVRSMSSDGDGYECMRCDERLRARPEHATVHYFAR